jgi:hypothetical protein
LEVDTSDGYQPGLDEIVSAGHFTVIWGWSHAG